MNQKNLYKYFLFVRPSFIEGFARVLDLGSTLEIYNESETEADADWRATADDWRAVGSDIQSAVRAYERDTARNTAAG